MSFMAARRCINLNVFLLCSVLLGEQISLFRNFLSRTSVSRQCQRTPWSLWFSPLARVILQCRYPTPAVLILLTCPKELSSSSDAEAQSIPLHTALKTDTTPLHISRHDSFIFTAQRCASVVYVVDVCLSARSSVCLSQDDIASKRPAWSIWFRHGGSLSPIGLLSANTTLRRCYKKFR